MNNCAVTIQNVIKNYILGKTLVEVLKGVSLQLEKGEWVALLGSSGSGKTTLLNIIGGIEPPDSGSLFLHGKAIEKRNKLAIEKLRRQEVGIIFQAYHLVPELTTIENVMLPALINGKTKREAAAHAESLLDAVGLAQRKNHKPLELSGGEQQRAAIARALINNPSLILADEPTGNLDSQTGAEILDLLKKIHSETTGEKTMLMVTHNLEAAKMADKIIRLKDGKILTET
jgi:ABC-type lipoprotein export system ATPase subunit